MATRKKTAAKKKVAASKKKVTKKATKKKVATRVITVHRKPQGPRTSPVGMVKKNADRLIASIDRLVGTDAMKDSYIKKVAAAVKKLR